MVTLDIPASGRSGALTLDEIANEFRGAQVPDKIMIVDACRNDSEDVGGVKGSRGTIPLRPFSHVPSMSGLVVFNAAAPGQFSYEDDEFQHGVFTHFLLQGLAGDTPTDVKHSISFEDLAKYVIDHVSDYEARKQHIQKPSWTALDRSSTASIVLVETAVQKTPPAQLLIDPTFVITTTVGSSPELTNLHRERLRAVQDIRLSDALRIATELIKKIPEEAHQYLVRANIYAMQNEYSQALNDVSTALRIDPSSISGRYQRGMLEAYLNQFDKANEDLSYVIEHEPDAFRAYAPLCQIKNSIGDWPAAVKSCTAALVHYLNDPQALFQRGLAFGGLQMMDRSIEDYSDVIRLQPGNAWAFGNRAIAYSGSGKPEEALRDFNEAIKLQPNTAMFRMQRANFLAFRMQLSEALSDADEVIRLEPLNATAYRLRANIKRQAGDLTGSNSDVTRAQEIEVGRSHQ